MTLMTNTAIKKSTFYHVTMLFQKNGCDFNTWNTERGILYDTDVITSIVKLTVHSPVDKLV